MEETRIASLRETDPKGRFDVMCYRLAEHFTKTVLEPALKGVPVWNNGLGEVAEEAIRRNLPAKAFTPVDIARAFGIFPPELQRRNRGRRK